jgi:nitrate reductase gamma subunit
VSDTFASIDVLLFAVLPYVALALLVWGTVERFRRRPYSVSTGSSQFLENRQHFWTVVPFHYGILTVLVAHLLAIALPNTLVAWNAEPLRLYLLEATGLAFGLLATIGFAGVVIRRATNQAVRATTQPSDWIVYTILLAQLATGVAVAITYTWGSAWSAGTLTPYLWSLALLRPDITLVSAMPVLIKTHVVGAFLLIAVFPFSRLVHLAYAPNSYFLRRPLVVRWYRPLPTRGGTSRGY